MNIPSWFACQAFEKLAMSSQKPLGDGWIAGLFLYNYSAHMADGVLTDPVGYVGPMC